ncbi:cobalamin biosynthesis protein CobG [Vreelandella olivaria]|uniref:cobalamin biosynthesis protein CobG n=1 Tax=Vreelandella olivaria TaxID=390919 RepID=UPI00201F8C90|nr:cobalamin biosynthesis protein CobG [Halomonas olivaria]
MPERPHIKGWCPGAWRPMATGDGLLVRVRPPLGELSRAQVLAMCDAADTYGNGLIELTSRANIQLRGSSESSWPDLMAFLVESALVDANPEAERQPQCMYVPDWQVGDQTHTLARLVQARGKEIASMPAKVGIAIDTGDAPVLGDAAADFRIERSREGDLLVRTEGYDAGTPVSSPEAAVEQLIRLTHWFVASGGREAGRMRRHREPLPEWAPAIKSPAPAGPRLALGKHESGMVYGLPFGRAPAAAWRAAVASNAVTHMRVTPWRRLLVKGADSPSVNGLISDDQDKRLLMDVCPGAPYCAQASVATQPLAERMSGLIENTVHISGCAKGCARQSPSAVCLVGHSGTFNLIVNGCVSSTPVQTGLSEAKVLAYLESLGDLSL